MLEPVPEVRPSFRGLCSHPWAEQSVEWERALELVQVLVLVEPARVFALASDLV
jgi:hypothetical protein